jgi:hypothetical protein
MKKESLDKALDLIANSNIDYIDKLELLINLNYMFETYEENINYLRKKDKDEKYEKRLFTSINTKHH